MHGTCSKYKINNFETKHTIHIIKTMFHIEKLFYDKQHNCYCGNARQLFDNIPYPSVTDVMIESYLNTNCVIDVMDGKHKGYIDELTHHAQRIASLIHLIKHHTILKPVVIFYNSHTNNAEIDDGWHRMRASYYLNENIHFNLVVD